MAPRVHFVANCMYGPHVGGGDIHFFQMAAAARAAGWDVRFIGGHALARQVAERCPGAPVALTDKAMLPPFNAATLGGQLRLLGDYLRRFTGSFKPLRDIRPDDLVYAATDYWFDALPALLSPARRKLMILGMTCPTLGQVLTAGRPDVPGARAAALYYWLSQNLSLALFRRARLKRLFYVHPDMLPGLRARGYRDEELAFISNGIDTAAITRVPEQAKTYDVVWVGRAHRQKGLDDLVECLAHLRQAIPGFRAVCLGRVREAILPGLQARGAADGVEFPGFVSDEEKFRLMKASRLFLMPSRYESWGIVIGEAIACGLPVLAYDLEAYRPVFSDLVSYVKPFDVPALTLAARSLLERLRTGESVLDPQRAAAFAQANSWETAGRIFTDTMRDLSA